MFTQTELLNFTEKLKTASIKYRVNMVTWSFLPFAVNVILIDHKLQTSASSLQFGVHDSGSRLRVTFYLCIVGYLQENKMADARRAVSR